MLLDLPELFQPLNSRHFKFLYQLLLHIEFRKLSHNSAVTKSSYNGFDYLQTGKPVENYAFMNFYLKKGDRLTDEKFAKIIWEGIRPPIQYKSLKIYVNNHFESAMLPDVRSEIDRIQDKIPIYIDILGWNSIREILIRNNYALEDYLRVADFMDPAWRHHEILEVVERKQIDQPSRMPSNVKIDRSAPPKGYLGPFPPNVLDQFESFVYGHHHLSKHKYLKTTKHVLFGHMQAYQHPDGTVYLFALTNQLEDKYLRIDTKDWIRYSCGKEVRLTLAKHFLLNGQRDLPKLIITFFTFATGFKSIGAPVDVPVEQIFPDYSKEGFNYVLSSVNLGDSEIHINQLKFIFKVKRKDTYTIPLESISESVLKEIISKKWFARCIPHSHRTYIDDEITYDRAVEGDKWGIIENNNYRLNKCNRCESKFLARHNEFYCCQCRQAYKQKQESSWSYKDKFKALLNRSDWDFDYPQNFL